jgi:hypothetical protein
MARPRFPPNPEASIAWERRQAEARRPPAHPAPLIRSRPFEPAALPASPALVLRVGEAAGWHVRPTFARGTRVDARGAPAGLAGSIALRCRRRGQYAIGVWVRIDGAKEPKWAYAFGMALGVGARGRLSAEGLKAVLRAPVA